MFDLISYLLAETLDLLISDYFAVAVGIPIVLGLIELVYIFMRGRRRT